MLKVIALDPGVTTGYALGLIKPDEPMTVGSGQEEWNVAQLHDFLIEQEPDIIIYEDFEYRNRARAGLVLFSRDLIGIVKLYAIGRERQFTPVEVYVQTAAVGKAYYSDKKLKEENVYKVANPHANDAVRHLLHWYTFKEGYRFNSRGIRSS